MYEDVCAIKNILIAVLCKNLSKIFTNLKKYDIIIVPNELNIRSIGIFPYVKIIPFFRFFRTSNVINFGKNATPV